VVRRGREAQRGDELAQQNNCTRTTVSAPDKDTNCTHTVSDTTSYWSHASRLRLRTDNSPLVAQQDAQPRSPHALTSPFRSFCLPSGRGESVLAQRCFPLLSLSNTWKVMKSVMSDKWRGSTAMPYTPKTPDTSCISDARAASMP
jgi:hypothetical protein